MFIAPFIHISKSDIRYLLKSDKAKGVCKEERREETGILLPFGSQKLPPSPVLFVGNLIRHNSN